MHSCVQMDLSFVYEDVYTHVITTCKNETRRRSQVFQFYLLQTTLT